MALVAGVAVVVAFAAAAVALRDGDTRRRPPRLPGWPAVGTRADSARLREVAWRGWQALDRSVRLEQVVMLLADEWPDAEREVVVLAMPYPDHIGVAVMLVSGDAAVRVRRLDMPADRGYIVEHVQVDAHSAVVALAPTAERVEVTTAVVGASSTETIDVSGRGGALVPVPTGRTATRALVFDATDKPLADRIPGSDLARTPAVTLITRETTDARGRRVQTRTDGEKLTCRVTLPGADEEALTRVACP